jgi:cytoskeletal protein CcmA (bactofilin family)
MFEKRDDFHLESGGKAAETIVGTSVKLKGNLRSDGDITIDGNVAGDIKTKSGVYVGPNANIIANIKAKDIEISGVVQGNIEASDKLEITETGKVFGDIMASVLVVAPGALFSGKCAMTEPKYEADLEPTLDIEEDLQPEEKTESKKEK